jgi:exodeoxyribonuclease V gamma subunit
MNTGLAIHISNRLEILVDGLAEGLRAASPDPLAPEIILVQSRGMQRWLSLNIARINGICANTRFPFPNAFFESLYSSIDPRPARENPYNTGALSFRSLGLLPDILNQPEIRPLHRYVTQDPHPLKLFQLASRVSAVFDQYTMFRPEMTISWESGQQLAGLSAEQTWQALLWNKLTAGIEFPDRAVQHKRLIAYLHGHDPAKMALPRRLFVFGISHLPSFHLQILDALSRHIPVAMFLLNPSRHYWSDIVSDQQLARMRNRGKIAATADVDGISHYDKGNRLLASLGQQGKHFLDLIYQYAAQEVDSFIDNDSGTLLGSIQQDILDLTDGSFSQAPAQQPTAAADGSIQVHSCHSPMREAEVLYDHLLDLLAKNTDLTPRDILVLTPDIGMYAPYIHAVFGTRGADQTQIPYSVADQTLMQESPCVESFVRLLDLYQSRFEVSKVMALLENPVIHQKFGLSMADLPLVERWINAVEIRWGWDPSERKDQGLPAYGDNSWRLGLDSLLLGYAMHSTGDQLFAGVLPRETAESGQSKVLSGLLLFVEALHQTMVDLKTPRNLTHWKTALNLICNHFFLNDNSTVYEMRQLRGLFDELEAIHHSSCFDQAVPFELIQHKIKETVASTVLEAGFFSGGITFCAMLPMRSIPCQVICLLGLNHDAFPRETHEPGFNLVTAQPRPGDRSKRNDDRYLFLEALVSARQVLYLSYIGRDIQDNSEIPPSTVVDELLEYIHDRYGIDPDALWTRHPLHGFSPLYFNAGDQKFFSYSGINCEAARGALHTEPTPPFFSGALALRGEGLQELDLDDLTGFFIHPTRYLCQRRLGVFFQDRSIRLNDRERFALDALDRFVVNQRLYKAYRRNISAEETYHILRSSGWLPHGRVGQIAYNRQDALVQAFMGVAEPFMTGPCRSQTFELNCGSFRIHGTIGDLYPQARVIARLGKIRPRDLVSQFLAHVLMACLPTLSFPAATVLVGTDFIYRFNSIEQPLALLDAFLKLYWQGMQAPLAFFEKTSLFFAEQVLIKAAPRERALAAALQKWTGDEYRSGESQDRYIACCFDHSTTLPPFFEENALAVYGPIFAATSCQPTYSSTFSPVGRPTAR